MSENWNMNGEEGAGAVEESAAGLGGEKKSSVSRSTLMLVGVFAVGLGMIWLLGQQAKPRPASAAQEMVDSQVDSAIADMLGKSGKQEQLTQLFKDTSRLVEMFYEVPGDGAVPAEDLPTNPFAYEGARTSVNPTPLIPMPAGDTEQQIRLRKAADYFTTLKLQSIMVSKNSSMAVINGQVVSLGARLGEFTVAEIEPQRVVLSLGANKFELKLKNKDEHGK